MSEPMCADCGGYDIEWMYRCEKHGCEYCRGCDCPVCLDEAEWDSLPLHPHQAPLTDAQEGGEAQEESKAHGKGKGYAVHRVRD
jgi:hypothetical protein